MPARRSQTTHPSVTSLLREQSPGIALYLAVSAVLVVCYPYPYLTSDSGSYVTSAISLVNNPYRPLGYALYLSGLHLIAGSAAAIPVFQAATWLLAVLFFLHHGLRGMGCSPGTRRILGGALLLNPLALFYAHHLLSDSLFGSMSLVYFGLLLRTMRERSARLLIGLVVSAGLCLLIRHVGLLYMLFAAIVIAVAEGRRCLRHLAVFAAGCAAVILMICGKMNADLGAFRLNTFDGWTLWAASAKYIDLSPEYRNQLTSPELRELYGYFASYPPERYSKASDLEVQWSPQSPAKQLLFSVIQTYGMDYNRAYVYTNDKLNLIARDIVLHRPLRYAMGTLLPACGQALWPDMLLNDTGWPDYPAYPSLSSPDRGIQVYYHESSNTWHATRDIFPTVKPVMDVWIRMLMPLLGLVVIFYAAFRRQTGRWHADAPFLAVSVAFIVFYVASIGGLSTIYTRYLLPTSALMTAVIVVGLTRGIAAVRAGSFVSVQSTPQAL